MSEEEIELLNKINVLPKKLNIEIRGLILCKLYLREENKHLKEKINKALHRIQLLQMDGEVSIRDLGKIANILIDKEVE